jgi:hypothetical protein
MMRKDAYLINGSRGPVVGESALYGGDISKMPYVVNKEAFQGKTPAHWGISLLLLSDSGHPGSV